MDNLKKAFEQTNLMMTESAKVGAQQAIATQAEKVIMEQVKKLLGDSFPAEFYQTPLGEAVLDMGCCYLAHMVACSFPTMPMASEVQGYSQHAMTGVAAKSFAPLAAMAQELLQGVAEQAKLVEPPREDTDAE